MNKIAQVTQCFCGTLIIFAGLIILDSVHTIQNIHLLEIITSYFVGSLFMLRGFISIMEALNLGEFE